MAGLNRGDEVAVNAACNSPHVRIAGGKVVVWQKRGEYKLEDFWARAGDGWARSQWDERTAIHVGPEKVHLKVKFSRFRGDGSCSANSRRSTSSPARTAVGASKHALLLRS